MLVSDTEEFWAGPKIAGRQKYERTGADKWLRMVELTTRISLSSDNHFILTAEVLSKDISTLLVTWDRFNANGFLLDYFT